MFHNLLQYNTKRGAYQMNYITLNNDVKMPIVGTGTNTYGKENNVFNGALKK